MHLSRVALCCASLSSCLPSSSSTPASARARDGASSRDARDPLATHAPQLVRIPRADPSQLRDVLTPELATLVLDARDAGVRDAAPSWEGVLVWREQAPCRGVQLGPQGPDATLCMRAQSASRTVQRHTLSLEIRGKRALEVPVEIGPMLTNVPSERVPTAALQVVITAADGLHLELRDSPRGGCGGPAAGDAVYKRERAKMCAARGTYTLENGAYVRGEGQPRVPYFE